MNQSTLSLQKSPLPSFALLEERRRRQNAYAAKTIIETARKRGKSLVSGLMDLFRSDNQASDPIPSDSASGAS